MSTTNGFMSYEDYLKDSEYMKKAQENAKNVLDKSVTEAKTSYKQALATYGANAEALGRMGLTGSGYSDYLTGQAYAQQRADINAANAQYNKTMSAAGYQDYLNYKTEAENYKDKQSQLYATFLGELYENGYSADEIKILAEAGGLTDSSGYLTKLGEAATAVENKAYLDAAKEKVFDGMFEGLSYADAKESLDELLADEKLTALHSDIQKYFDKAYDGVNLNVEGITAIRSDKTKPVIIKDGDGKEFYFTLGDKADDNIVKTLGTGKNNQIAKIKDDFYIYIEDPKFGDGWFKLDNRGKLVTAIYGDAVENLTNHLKSKEKEKDTKPSENSTVDSTTEKENTGSAAIPIGYYQGSPIW